eukprot:gb/GECG01015945.1/.p1 GENE.gb/GECG01015945.1/~~gb/GECG01015945.1/.p1  ORF type:complete len:995 (+),score=95.76 gb/GECG01015945.1/:1-2985(+)
MSAARQKNNGTIHLVSPFSQEGDDCFGLAPGCDLHVHDAGLGGGYHSNIVFVKAIKDLAWRLENSATDKDAKVAQQLSRRIVGVRRYGYEDKKSTYPSGTSDFVSEEAAKILEQGRAKCRWQDISVRKCGPQSDCVFKKNFQQNFKQIARSLCRIVNGRVHISLHELLCEKVNLKECHRPKLGEFLRLALSAIQGSEDSPRTSSDVPHRFLPSIFPLRKANHCFPTKEDDAMMQYSESPREVTQHVDRYEEYLLAACKDYREEEVSYVEVSISCNKLRDDFFFWKDVGEKAITEHGVTLRYLCCFHWNDSVSENGVDIRQRIRGDYNIKIPTAAKAAFQHLECIFKKAGASTFVVGVDVTGDEFSGLIRQHVILFLHDSFKSFLKQQELGVRLHFGERHFEECRCQCGAKSRLCQCRNRAGRLTICRWLDIFCLYEEGIPVRLAHGTCALFVLWRLAAEVYPECLTERMVRALQTEETTVPFRWLKKTLVGGDTSKKTLRKVVEDRVSEHTSFPVPERTKIALSLRYIVNRLVEAISSGDTPLSEKNAIGLDLSITSNILLRKRGIRDIMTMLQRCAISSLTTDMPSVFARPFQTGVVTGELLWATRMLAIPGSILRAMQQNAFVLSFRRNAEGASSPSRHVMDNGQSCLSHLSHLEKIIISYLLQIVFRTRERPLIPGKTCSNENRSSRVIGHVLQLGTFSNEKKLITFELLKISCKQHASGSDLKKCRLGLHGPGSMEAREEKAFLHSQDLQGSCPNYCQRRKRNASSSRPCRPSGTAKGTFHLMNGNDGPGNRKDAWPFQSERSANMDRYQLCVHYHPSGNDRLSRIHDWRSHNWCDFAVPFCKIHYSSRCACVPPVVADTIIRCRKAVTDDTVAVTKGHVKEVSGAKPYVVFAPIPAKDNRDLVSEANSMISFSLENDENENIWEDEEEFLRIENDCVEKFNNKFELARKLVYLEVSTSASVTSSTASFDTDSATQSNTASNTESNTASH